MVGITNRFSPMGERRCSTMMSRYYKMPALRTEESQRLLSLAKKIEPTANGVEAEVCFNVETHTAPLCPSSEVIISWLMSETFEPDMFRKDISFLEDKVCAGMDGKDKEEGCFVLVEVGPNQSFCTAFSSIAVGICANMGLNHINRIEKTSRYKVLFDKSSIDLQKFKSQFSACVHDRMTQTVYQKPMELFSSGHKDLKEDWVSVDIIKGGKEALRSASKEMGLNFDETDVTYYYDFFFKKLQRNPTNVECFDLGQSNSEHSRHWFFNGRLNLDGVWMEKCLFDLVKEPYKNQIKNGNCNSTIAFSDNASAIRGFTVWTLPPVYADTALPEYKAILRSYDITFTAETHNFPTGVAPFAGAETGSGGRMRDGHCAGRGSLLLAGTAGYCVGNLCMEGYDMEWEEKDWVYPNQMAKPMDILIEASNGVSDYGNKFGEPVVNGFVRSFGMRIPNGERREWVKPIMFSGGIGQIDCSHRQKAPASVGLLIVKLGGPAYRIGIGGGAASSKISGDNEELDFNAVQRGDAEMGQRLNRVIRVCAEMGENNPIQSIHDQGTGGAGNVLKEIVNPAGGLIDISRTLKGDDTMSLLELWVAEYQENDAVLIKPEDVCRFSAICERERCPRSVMGHVTGDGYIRVAKDKESFKELAEKISLNSKQTEKVEMPFQFDVCPVDLRLADVLGDLPPKEYFDTTKPKCLKPFVVSSSTTVCGALNRVLRLLSVGSKRFLVNKVDRSVGGLVAQQQTVGPLQLPLANLAVIAQSYLSLTGAATALGERPIAGLIDCEKMARLCVSEALCNLVWVKSTALSDVKFEGNWMWAAKMEGEAVEMFKAATALSQYMQELGVAIDGGKDSLSMACRIPGEIVKCPGQLTVSAYVTVPDITRVVTPDLKKNTLSLKSTSIIFLDLSKPTASSGSGNRLSRVNLGGSALTQVYGELGDVCCDAQDADIIKKAWEATQEMVDDGLLSAGHDRSEGGLITTLLEMAFGGNCGLVINLQSSFFSNSQSSSLDTTKCNDSNIDIYGYLFSEGPGLVFEVDDMQLNDVMGVIAKHGLSHICANIGKSHADDVVAISVDSEIVLNDKTSRLRDVWESTSFECEKRQKNVECVNAEQSGLKDRKEPTFIINHKYSPTAGIGANRWKVAVLREEGTNGDRELAAAFYMAGMLPIDVMMTDLRGGRLTDLTSFRGIAFAGGFSFADAFGSAKGWAGGIKYKLFKVFDDFYKRKDTFSLGVCNGCQLMALLGWLGPLQEKDDRQLPRFVENKSDCHECRWVSIRIMESTAIMLKQMSGTVMGSWVAHKEGYMHIQDSKSLAELRDNKQIPAVFVNDQGEATERYPFNPNGSPGGAVGLCSSDGRHLAMMSHPERSVLLWQWPHLPAELRYKQESKGGETNTTVETNNAKCESQEERIKHLLVSPWIRMFQNAREWCDEN